MMIVTNETLGRADLRPQELDAQEVVELPERAAMSLVNANLALPINLALAANVLSDNAAALAGAEQKTPINQGMFGATNPLGS